MTQKFYMYESTMTENVYYDRNTRPMPDLKSGDVVRIREGDEWKPAEIRAKYDKPRR